MLPLESVIAPRLKSLGFRKKARTWWRDRDETIQVVNLQKSPYSERLHVNLGIYVRVLGTDTSPSERHCQIRARLETVAPEACWNDVVSLEALVAPPPTVIDAVVVSAIDWLESLARVEDIRAFVDSPKSKPFLIFATARAL